jgi:hypothetical protein
LEDKFYTLIHFLKSMPAIDLPAGEQSIGAGVFENGNWWVKFSLNTKHPLAWRHVQELGHVLNYISIDDRLPTVFMPVSPPPYLNGGEEFLSWVIESTEKEFAPDACAEYLEGHLPTPIDDLSAWEVADNQ